MDGIEFGEDGVVFGFGYCFDVGDGSVDFVVEGCDYVIFVSVMVLYLWVMLWFVVGLVIVMWNCVVGCMLFLVLNVLYIIVMLFVVVNLFRLVLVIRFVKGWIEVMVLF